MSIDRTLWFLVFCHNLMDLSECFVSLVNKITFRTEACVSEKVWDNKNIWVLWCINIYFVGGAKYYWNHWNAIFFTFCSPELLPNCKFSLHVPFISVEKPQKHWKKFNKKKTTKNISRRETWIKIDQDRYFISNRICDQNL